MIYLTTMLVRNEGTEEQGVNAILHTAVEGISIDEISTHSEYDFQNAMSDSVVEESYFSIPPGGNRVRAYADFIHDSDECRKKNVVKAFKELKKRVKSREPNPISTPIKIDGAEAFIVFSTNIGLENQKDRLRILEAFRRVSTRLVSQG